MPRPLTLRSFARLPDWPALATAAWLLASVAARADDLTELRAVMARGDLLTALQRADQAIIRQPRDAQLRFMRGVVLMDLARDTEALAVFTQLAQEHPDLPDPYNNIGLLQARAGRPEAALAALEDALRCDPGHRTARANLGQVHLMLAVKAWDQLASSGPLDAALRRKLEAVRAVAAPGPLPAATAVPAR